MMWLVQMLQDKLRGTQAAAICQYPVAMQGKSLTAMTETDFHCSTYPVLAACVVTGFTFSEVNTVV
jgi:hypothetical protein